MQAKPADALAANVNALRTLRGLTRVDLAKRIQELGGAHPSARQGAKSLSAYAIGSIEKRYGEDDRARERTRVDVDDLVTLALALNVPPSRLLLPSDGDSLRLTADYDVRRDVAEMWFYGERAVPDDADDDAYLAELPSGMQRRRMAARYVEGQGIHPLVIAISTLDAFVLDVLSRDDDNAREHPREHAEALRRSADRVRRYARALADDLDAWADEQGI